MSLSERQRDPRFRTRSRANRRSIYGGLPVNFGGTGTRAKTPKPPSVSTAALGAALAAEKPVASIDQILASDPGYQLARANLLAQGVSDRTSRDAALRRALIDFGMPIDPSRLSSGAKDALEEILDSQTRGLIDANTRSGMSTSARLQQIAADQQKRVVDSLAARGMYRSGETGYGLNRAQLAADQNRYDAIRNVLDYIEGVQAGFAEAERQRALAEAQAQQQAVENAPEWAGLIPTYGGVADIPLPVPSAPLPTAPLPPSVLGSLLPKKTMPKKTKPLPIPSF